MTNQNPVGFIDSGVGGLSLRSSFEELLPNERMCYIADEAYSPYGEKTSDIILGRCKKLTEFLLKANCKLIVLACNTATTQVINLLREQYAVPFVGIEPAIKPAALSSLTNVIGVLATQGTLKSQLFAKNSFTHASQIKVLEQIGHGLIEIVENQKINTQSSESILRKYLEPMVAQQMDRLVLGCTHYPFLLPTIKKIIPQHIQIIDNSHAVIKQVKRLLTNHSTLHNSSPLIKHQYYATLEKNLLQNFLKANENVSYLPL